MNPYSHGICQLSTVLQGGITMQHRDHKFKLFLFLQKWLLAWVLTFWALTCLSYYYIYLGGVVNIKCNNLNRVLGIIPECGAL